MKFFIYARSSSEHIINFAIERSKAFCLQNNIKIENIFHDLGISPLSPKKRWNGFTNLISAAEPGDCIVCDRIFDLPPFFLENPTLTVQNEMISKIDELKEHAHLDNKDLVKIIFSMRPGHLRSKKYP